MFIDESLSARHSVAPRTSRHDHALLVVAVPASHAMAVEVIRDDLPILLELPIAEPS